MICSSILVQRQLFCSSWLSSFWCAKTKEKGIQIYFFVFDGTVLRILKKVGEECTEVIIAGEKEDKAETVYEISDLAYHVLVLMVSAGITVEDVTRELEKRHVIDHKVKQERMQ